ncbi:MAG: helix-turn-helix domain-containing protein [Ancrocorticia sp.]|uniref:helix-turn-helix domain-containing protein n=1 Tax=Ancrocorticia sp. TaxID=2593684 RepID=UPI003F92E8B8
MFPPLTLENEAQRDEARSITRDIAPEDDVAFEIDLGADGPIKLSPELSGVVLNLLRDLGSGARISVVSAPEELTTTEAARVIGISRPTLMKAVRNGDIESFKVGSHTRFKNEEVQAFRQRRQAAQHAAFDRLRSLEEDLNIADS